MSAHICHPATPDTLAGVASPDLIARTVARIYPRSAPVGAHVMTEARRAVARYLASVNVRAVAYRYPGEALADLPGHVYAEWAQGGIHHPMPSDSAHPYTLTRVARELDAARRNGDSTAALALAGRVLGLAECYAYQASELPEWDGSAAREFVDAVRLEVAEVFEHGWDYGSEVGDL